MILLHQIGKRINPNFNTLEEILACNEPLSFDGVYMSVYENYKALKGKSITFFVSGKYLGGDNSFDKGQPLSRYCTLEQICEMATYLNASIGYHGYAHQHCHLISAEEMRKEIMPPAWLDPLTKFYNRSDERFILAWPYGDYTSTAIETAKAMGYGHAYSVTQGDGSVFALKRRHLNW